MAITDAEFKTWIETPGLRREYLLELDYLVPEFRFGGDPLVSQSPRIDSKMLRTITGQSLTIVSEIMAPAAPGADAHIIDANGGYLDVWVTSGLNLKARLNDGTTSVTGTFGAPALVANTPAEIRIEVDRDTDEIRAYIDGAECASPVGISTVTGDLAITDVYMIADDEGVQVGGVQVYDSILTGAALTNAGGPNPDRGLINGWAAITYPARKRYALSFDRVFAVDYLYGNANAEQHFNNLDVEAVTFALENRANRTLYLSMGGFISDGADTPASTPYDARLQAPPALTQQTPDDFFGLANESVSGVTLANHDGALSYLLRVLATDSAAKILVGDPGWPRSDYRVLLDGIATGVGSDGTNITLALGGKIEALKVQVGYPHLNGAVPGKSYPLAYGNVHNITPQLTNATTHEYRYGHLANKTDLGTVYDDGLAVSHTDADPLFTLAAAPSGQVTASLNITETEDAYQIGTMINELITEFTALTAADLDADVGATSSFPSVDPRTTYAGLYIRAGEEQPLNEILNHLARGGWSLLHTQRDGKLHLNHYIADWYGSVVWRWRKGRPTTAYECTRIALVRQVMPVGSVALQSSKNYSPLQPGSGVAEGGRPQFIEPYNQIVPFDDGDAEYPAATPSGIFDFGLISLGDPSDNDIEEYHATAARLFYGQLQGVYRCDLSWSPVLVELGDWVEVSDPRTFPHGIIGWIVGKHVAADGTGWLQVLSNGH